MECARIVHDESLFLNGDMRVNPTTSNHHDGVTLITRWGHVPFNCWFCCYFSGYIPANLCFPFGWTGSPVYYSIAEQSIKAIHNSQPSFHNLVYCDDHILIGYGRRFETMVFGIAFRRAMVTVLGTISCNEKKFTTWQRLCKALSHIFDFDS